MSRTTLQSTAFFAVCAVLSSLAQAKEPPSPAKPPPPTVRSSQWATLSESRDHQYQVRLLSEAEKTKAETLVREHSAAPGESRPTDVAEAYRKLPLDMQSGRFYRVVRFDANFVELDHPEMHAILPMSSVRIILKGTKGGLQLPGSSSGRANDLLRALRGGGGGASGRVPGGAFGSAGGRRGGSSPGLLGGAPANNKPPAKEPDKVTIYYLKFAKAENAMRIVQGVVDSDGGLRVMVDARINALIVKAGPETLKVIEQLLETIDRESPLEKAGKPFDPTTQYIKTYELKKVDPAVAFRTLQTLLAGGDDVRLDLDPKTRRIIVLATKSRHAVVESVVELLEADP